ncbi:cystathionine gamma-synthase [Parashewanella tropica]|uniref:cystathionine gamma-synthase n=1 Tax=Parashewanella tropica TaxID=2547970 RepID=UPI0010597866|nr:cystathionine gamma-synthase [Parashewanella tropica]
MSNNNQQHTYAHTQTSAVRSGLDTDTAHGAVMPPIYLSSNFSFESYNQPRKYDYTRSGNPTRDLLAEALAELEGGHGAVITPTGMAAVNLVLQLLTPEDTLLVPHDCYGGSYRLFEHASKRGLFKLTIVDQNDSAALQQALEQQPRLVWVETPSNPLLRIYDIEAICQQAHQVGALVAVDNTFLTPLWQKPFELGADIVIHSTTKYINGHSDVVGGAVIAKNQELHEKLAWWANCIGATAAPFDSYMTLRGVRTLHARLQIHEQNTKSVVDYLNQHPAIKKVYHPSLKSHSGHEIAAKQQSGFGAMLSVELDLGSETQDYPQLLTHFFNSLSMFTLAESLGGVESLVCHPATMTHAGISEEARKTAGISESLLRFSIGIEHNEDLLADLSRALESLSALKQKLTEK